MADTNLTRKLQRKHARGVGRGWLRRHRPRGHARLLRARGEARAPDAWIDEERTKVGYEIPFNRHFYVFTPPRPLAAIDGDLKGVTERIMKMLGGLSQ
jgi:hypothetical protein